MLAAPTFTQSVMNATNTNEASAIAVMGEYYPTGTQCKKATFAAGGAAACFANPASPS
jgi:ribosomal protein S16